MANRNKWACLNRAKDFLWGHCTLLTAQGWENPPVVLNNESVLGVNAAGTGTVALIKANASDEAEVVNNLTVTGDLTVTGSSTVSGASIVSGVISDDITLATNKKVQFRDTGLFINSGADGKLTISADGVGTDDITLAGTVSVSDDVLLATTKKVGFRDAGLYINSGADGKLTISADGVGTDDITLDGTVSVADDVLLATNKKVGFRDAGLYIQSGADGKLTIAADGIGTDDITLDGTVSVSDDVLLATDKKIGFRDAGLYIQSGADGKLTIAADGVGDDDVTISGTLKVTEGITTATAAALTLGAAGFTQAAIARTATADGTGTGTIASGPMLQMISVTSDNADKIIILPAPTPGTIVILHVAATGYELRTSDPATIGINGGTDANAESAIGANVTAVLICATATSWKGLQLGADGTLAKVEVAAA